MKNKIKERVIQFALYIKETHDTIRQTAKIFGVSKSTVHNDVSTKLRKINYDLYKKVQKILNENFEQKHIRGGLATKSKYLQKRLKFNKNMLF